MGIARQGVGWLGVHAGWRHLSLPAAHCDRLPTVYMYVGLEWPPRPKCSAAIRYLLLVSTAISR